MIFTQSLVIAWQKNLLARLEEAAKAYDQAGDENGATALRVFASGVAEGLAQS